MNAPLDQTHAESIAYIRWLRRAFFEAAQRVDRWEPRPMPEGFGGLDVGCPDSAGWACGRPFCPSCAPGLARINGERFGDDPLLGR